MKIPLPTGEYIKKLEINDDGIDITYAPRKKIALVFICINYQYWPYLKQVLEDAKVNFLPQHNVDYFAWTDIPKEDTNDFSKNLAELPTRASVEEKRKFAKNVDELAQTHKIVARETIRESVDYIRANLTIFEADPITWPMGTLLRYHLFLEQEALLKEYEYIFYCDVDMRIVQKVSDEILGEGLTAAEHPMYALKQGLIPPYEPNPDSTAYIPRPGRVIEENGQKRFKPDYYAGGFQGGKSGIFIEAMKVMKKNINRDLEKNYTAIWNDESHWNRYLFDFKGPLVVLDPSYIYPDSLIKEYYEPRWGRSYEPKIITLTKPWMLTKEAAADIRKEVGAPEQSTQLLQNQIKCEKCSMSFGPNAGFNLQYVVECAGYGNAHPISMVKI